MRGKQASHGVGAQVTVGDLHTTTGSYPLLYVDVEDQIAQDSTISPNSFWDTQGYSPWGAR